MHKYFDFILLYFIIKNKSEYKFMEELPKRLKELRIQYGYTQKYISERLGIVYQSYQAYEWGISLPTLENFIKLADLYDVSLDYLIGRKEY
jgi:transcriptional regulator with XRE-family HTH domain